MKLCVFQGTFNPIHKAHLRVAQDVISHYDFDKILFIPAYNPPHKNADLDFSKHRLKMVQLAVKINPRFEVSDIEFKREGQVFGVGCKIFTIAGPVILYGLVTSWGLGLVYWIGTLLGVV